MISLHQWQAFSFNIIFDLSRVFTVQQLPYPSEKLFLLIKLIYTAALDIQYIHTEDLNNNNNISEKLHWVVSCHQVAISVCVLISEIICCSLSAGSEWKSYYLDLNEWQSLPGVNVVHERNRNWQLGQRVHAAVRLKKQSTPPKMQSLATILANYTQPPRFCSMELLIC